MKIALFGGSFDPIHLAHIDIAKSAVHKLSLDKVLFLPCKQSPHKLQHKLAAAHHRLKMCKLAVESYEWAEVENFELCSPPPSYSWRTAEHYHSKYPKAKLFWLMGSDQWNAMHLWSRYEYFTELVQIIVCTRGSNCLNTLEIEPIIISCSHSASSTQIREALSKGGQAQWLDKNVFAYLKEHKLYC